MYPDQTRNEIFENKAPDLFLTCYNIKKKKLINNIIYYKIYNFNLLYIGGLQDIFFFLLYSKYIKYL